MTTTKDRWRRGERVRHPTHGEARVSHVEASGLAYARNASAAYHPMQPVAVEYAAGGWRRDPQAPLFDEDTQAALDAVGSWV